MKEYIVVEHPDFPYEEPKPKELIRCKDCKYFNGNDKWCDYDRHVYNEDFCSSAERKEE